MFLTHNESGPSVVGSSLTLIYPIRPTVSSSDAENRPLTTIMQGHHGGGASSSSSSSCRKNQQQYCGSVIQAASSSRKNQQQYCSRNPCINSIIHDLHMDVLKGVAGADLELHRYLLVCAVLRDSVPKGASSSYAETGGTSSHAEEGAFIKWVCDICHSEDHSIVMTKKSYKQQFRAWRPPKFFGCRKQQQATPLTLPVSACLVTPLECTIQYNMLPDLGMFFRGILQRRYYTDASKKQWVRCMLGTSSGSSTKAANMVQSQQQFLLQKYHLNWGYMHGICANLLQDSIPCMKRAKRTHNTSSSSSSAKISTNSHANAAEILACLNVMYGTLLKLYPLGAKSPTFNAKVNLVQKMLLLTSSMHGEQQLDFIYKYSSLMRLCFMEYSINALMDWLPVERELLFESEAFLQHRSAMQAYSTIVVAACDIFRQDTIHTGNESWEQLNSSASCCIDRCIRVCKFKLFRMPEPIFRGPHMQADCFVPESLGSQMPLVSCKELCMQIFSGDERKSDGTMLLHSNLKVFQLPECVVAHQLESLDRLHSHCSKTLLAAQQLSFCTVCAINGRGTATTSGSSMSGGIGQSFSHSKLRMCCQTGELSCISCPVGTVVTVNLTGVLLKICATYYFMCPRSVGCMCDCYWVDVYDYSISWTPRGYAAKVKAAS